MTSIISKKTPSGLINAQEAWSIWGTLSAKYQFVEKLSLWQNFVHDSDFDRFLKTVSSKEQKIIARLEKKVKQFSLQCPDVGVKDFNTRANTEVIRDEFIAQDVFIWLQGITELLLRAIRTSTTNDDLRTVFMSISKTNLKLLDDIIVFLKRKGWINVGLQYPNIPNNTSEPINASEAFHLWDQLTFRYDNIRFTETYSSLIEDEVFRTLVNVGLAVVLNRQAAKLEKECLYFGIPLPKKPAKFSSWPDDASNFVSDDFIYRILYSGIVGATLIHVAAVKQSVTNDRIRRFFMDLLISEVEIQDKLIKYGKTKGYLNVPPEYNLE